MGCVLPRTPLDYCAALNTALQSLLYATGALIFRRKYHSFYIYYRRKAVINPAAVLIRQPIHGGEDMFADDWEEDKFNEAFDETIVQVQRLREHDPQFDIDQLRHMLNTACLRMENNPAGHSAVAEVAGEGTIAAYQQALAEWERELTNSAPRED
jgi:hypothetical protein